MNSILFGIREPKNNNQHSVVHDEKGKMKVKLSLVVIFFIVGCHTEKGTKFEDKESNLKGDDTLLVEKNDSLKANKQEESLTFLDSISKKYELSVHQIRSHTIIDSIYYTGMLMNTVFTGDTIVNFRNGYKGAIITYDDKRSCIYKFLLVFNPSGNLNTDNKIIYTDCDHDESADYTTVRYKLLNDAAFETIENYFPANSENIYETHTIKWSVSGVGLIDSIPHQ